MSIGLCKNMGLKQKNTTSYNPQGNSIIKRIHQVLGNAIWSFELKNQELDENHPFDEALAAAPYAIRCTYHMTLKATPGQLVFGQDMHLPTQFIAEWAAIGIRKQAEINCNNARENKKCVQWEYSIGDQVLLEKPGLIPKLSSPCIDFISTLSVWLYVTTNVYHPILGK